MKREQKYYCIKTLLNVDYNNEILFEKNKWYYSSDFYDRIPNQIQNEIGICLENEPNSGLSFNINIDPNYQKSPLLFDYFATLKKIRLMKLQKLNSL